MLLLGEILNRDVTTLLTLEVLKWILVPLTPLSATTNYVESLINGVAHTLLVGLTLAGNVVGYAVVGRCAHLRKRCCEVRRI